MPRYSLGDIITPPLAQADGVTPAAPGYWRQQPVLPGESFQGVLAGDPLFPLGTVNVTEAATNSTLVTVAEPLPPELVVGATLLGQPITGILVLGIAALITLWRPVFGLGVLAVSIVFGPFAARLSYREDSA